MEVLVVDELSFREFVSEVGVDLWDLVGALND